MKKPTPPTTPNADSSQNGSLEVRHPPISSPLDFSQESPFIDPLSLPVFGAGLTSDSICGACKNLWAMEIGGQVQNRKPDGSEYTKIERYCIFGENLVSLAERAVKSCSRFERKS